MATYYPSKPNCEKGKSDSLETLPNELILKIFTYLTIKDLGRCAQVSKNFNIIAYDRTLWTKILVTSCMPPNSFNLPLRHRSSCVMPHRLLVQALKRGARHLALSNLNFISTSQPNFPTTNQVEYLALSSSLIDEKYFGELILSCHNLKKLSVNDGYWKSDDLMKGILQNSNSLTVLDLSGCDKLKRQDVKSIISSCLELTEANFDHMTSLSSTFANLTTNIEKLSLSGTAIGINDITEILTKCNKLTDLDLTWAHLLVPKIGHKNIKFPKKTQLKSLYLRGFNIKFNLLKLLVLSCENTLQVLDVSYCNMTPESIELIVSRCLYLTAVDFSGEKHASIICKNVTQNIEKVSLSSTDALNDDIKTLVSRCNKIKKLDISHTDVVIDVVTDEILLHLSSTLEKLCLPTYSPRSKFETSSLSKLGSMPILQHLRMPLPKTHQSESEIEDLLDFWENQFPNIVLSCNSFDPIITQPNISKSMSMEERIWEISCEGIKLSAIQEDDPEENKIDNSYSDFIARELLEFREWNMRQLQILSN